MGDVRKHILDEINFIILETKNLTFDDFLSSPILTRAFIRSLEIIGEAVKKIPIELKNKYKDVHLVWDVLINKIPDLKIKLDFIISNENFVI